MSSYQFVNSLTSCYGQPRPGPDSAQTPPDYYTPQVYNNCYATAANNAVTAATAQPTSPANAYSAYLQNGDHHSSHHHSSHPHVSTHHRELHPYSSNSCSQSTAQAVVQSRLSHHSSAQPILPSRTPTSPSSCKYAQDSASSPQDLSTSSGGAGQSPEPRASPPQRSSAGSQQNVPQPTGANTAQNNSQGNGANGGQGKNGTYGSQNPPHIYPWMRKVHVGQSKSTHLFSMSARVRPARPTRPTCPNVVSRRLSWRCLGCVVLAVDVVMVRRCSGECVVDVV
jgi:Antp family protein